MTEVDKVEDKTENEYSLDFGMNLYKRQKTDKDKDLKVGDIEDVSYKYKQPCKVLVIVVEITETQVISQLYKQTTIFILSDGRERKEGDLWQHEPDCITWIDEYSGYRCFIRRSYSARSEELPEFARMFFLCGYVLIPSFVSLPAEEDLERTIEAHGGITYDKVITVEWGDDTSNLESADGRLIGFDCAHCGDILGGIGILSGSEFGGETYKDIKYVTDECIMLAVQLKDLEKQE